MRTTFTKTELGELLSIKLEENRKLIKQVQELQAENNSLEIQRNNAYHELEENKSFMKENTEHKDRLQKQLNIIDNLKTLIGEMYNQIEELRK